MFRVSGGPVLWFFGWSRASAWFAGGRGGAREAEVPRTEGSCARRKGLHQEDIEVRRHIAAERAAPRESVAEVQGVCGREGLSGAGLQIEMGVPPAPCGPHDLAEDGLPDPAPEVGVARPHGLDLAKPGAERLERAASAHPSVQPRRPEGDLGSPERVDRQRMHLPGRRVDVHAREVFQD